MAIGDDGIDWDLEAERAKTDTPFTSSEAFDYFKELVKLNMKVLDLGCNIAKWYPAFHKLGVDYEGLDFSPVAIEEARRRYPEVTFYLMKAQEMPFKEKYDLIFTHTVLQHMHLHTKKEVMPRIRRALKKSGFLVIQEKSDANTETTFTREGWIRFVTEFGFKLLRCTDISDPRNGYVFEKLSGGYQK